MPSNLPPDPTIPKPATRISQRTAAASVTALLLVVLIVWQLPSWRAQAQAGAAYGARIGCSCRYVQGRDLASCETDFEPGMELVSIADEPEMRGVTASVPLLASRRARYAGKSGCILDPA